MAGRRDAAGGATGARPSADPRVGEILPWLARRGTRRNRDGMARYGIVSPQLFGVSVTDLRARARRYGHDHALADALWTSGSHEARLLAVFIDDPAAVTPAQMDRWAGQFDNWAVCDTACFHLFDRTPHAWRKVDVWSRRRGEYVRRAAFALLASLAVHARDAPDDTFLARLPLIEAAATDERNFVRKAVSWALRAIGKRNPVLRAHATATAKRLAASNDRTARWVGTDAQRDLGRLRKARPAGTSAAKRSPRALPRKATPTSRRCLTR